MTVRVAYVASDDKPNGANINYQPGVVLNWNDFKGKPVDGSDAAAITSAGFGIKLSFKRFERASELLIAVNCSFSKKNSWVKPNHKTSYILNHEQRHFDVAYIHTMRFITRLQNAKFTATNYTSVIEKIYKETAIEMAQMQNEYDSESDHSRNAETQTEWNEKIAKILSSASLVKK